MNSGSLLLAHMKALWTLGSHFCHFVKHWCGTFSLSNGATAQGGPRPPSSVSSILPGLGRLFSNFYTLALLHLPPPVYSACRIWCGTYNDLKPASCPWLPLCIMSVTLRTILSVGGCLVLCRVRCQCHLYQTLHVLGIVSAQNHLVFFMQHHCFLPCLQKPIAGLCLESVHSTTIF
jgi:hypothetical protein